MGKNFYYLWVSQILSQVTVNMMNFLLLAKLFNATGSSIATSLLWVSYALPAIFFGPIGAGVVDLVSRRKTLVITNLLQAVVIFLYIFGHNYSVFLLFAVVLSYSFLNQFYVPAENASLPSVISKEKLPKANSLFFLTSQLALVIGFGFAGIIEKLVGFEGSLIIASSMLFIAFLSVYLLPNVTPRKKLPTDWEALMKVFFDHLIEGYKFIKTKKTVLYPLILLFFIQVGLSIITANLPSIAKEILHISTSYVGLLVVVPAGIGATIGSISVSKLLKVGWRKKQIIDLSLAILGLSVMGLVFGKLISTPILVLLVGMGFIGVNIPTLTFLQENTPQWLRGRVFGNLWFLITIATIFPIIFSGVVSEFFGVKTLLTIMSLGVILILMYSIRNGQKLIEENFN
ncbi:hypothetical protein A2130_02040 [Candidatus Woesebacteria bacterium GWC2_33_12]|uniref:Major facilitator superfamily (MFS) profile domain-containing protein n=1 Tax=Candidatus Woesebacteria bacterium GW2011_GWB1_33_22 TaxID=1618566 RepID=A0A0F9ZL92_9BACT|nr:MAG: hypothetical protein UR29_C0003G0041 [Candidatus Woesebacteria bacterium GW2011_GWC2_33_12]KKP42282.1 MAG: hypothetical protein UR33_C0004G0041 [Candidatus Woesebacteria bacterium GW2011_GWA2_33_20]KKP45013.1 MAG: hypothetical protein UR35_C0004G0045 [Candidatus Woesebacteria bacterium GW2011_GWB1_33_22]KKP46862.1 MAG: hypothetical protein UR37_C0004G0041 [Microgenomates group bacterium GW2011_GWC1_33_28]KKP50734.1 MAG: hypothetical protein UR41_C0004G0045 [Candidatus Woesebacteria bact